MLAKVTVLAVLSSVFVLIPAPRAEAVETAVVDTRTPRLHPAEPGSVRAAETGVQFDMLGITVARSTKEHAHARARSGGQWSPWRELDINPDHRPSGREGSLGSSHASGFHSDPIWFGGADAYEVVVPADAGALEVHLVRSEVRIVATGAEPQAAAAETATDPERPAINTRARWGARPPKEQPSIAPDLKLAVVHHSVSANAYTRDDVPKMLRSIQAYHMDAQGWNDIAYNFAVDRFGRIWEARAGGVGKMVIGGHARGFNTFSVGVVVLGDFTSAAPSQASVDAVADVIGWKFAHHQVDVRGTAPFTSLGGPRYETGAVANLPRVVGHRDVGRTGCPGDQLHRRLGEIRAKAAARFDKYIELQPETPLFGDFDGDGLRDVVRYRPGTRPDIVWSHPGTGIAERWVKVGGTYRPVVANLDGDRYDDILWYAPGSRPPDQLWYGGPSGFTITEVDLPDHGLPVVAELDGDGIDDVILYSPGPAADRVYLGSSNRALAIVDITVDETYLPSVGDFDGDGRDDVFWYGYGKAEDAIWFSDGAGTFTTVSTPAASGDSVPILGDFDGNGLHDVLFYGPGDAPDELWWGELGPRGAHVVEPLTISGPGFIPQVGDMTGNGGDDVFWYEPGPGPDPLWSWLPAHLMTERSHSVNGTYVPNVGRYTNDGFDDVIWMSPTTVSHLWVATGGGGFRGTTLR